MIPNINGITENNANNPERKVKDPAKTTFSSIFDVHNDGKIDSGDFSKKDIENAQIAAFLEKYNGQEWSQELENEIKPELNKSNEENLQAEVGKNKISIQGDKIVITTKKKTVEIAITKDNTVDKDDIQNLLNVLSSFTPKEIEDFKKEINEINLKDELIMHGLGFFNSNDTMDLSTNENNYGIVKPTVIHELGHGVSLRYRNEEKKNNVFNYNSELYENFDGILGVDKFFQELQSKYGKFDKNNDKTYGDGYALRHVNEFFAEYYLYKQEGKTAHGSEKLFTAFENSDDKKIQKLMDIMDKSLKFNSKSQKLRKK